jgi:hypothetical protein
VTTGGEHQLVVGQIGRPAGAQDAHGDVLVDDDHETDAESIVFVVRAAAEERVGGADGIECRLELGGEVAVGETAEVLAIGFGEARVACAAPPPAFFEQLLTDAHVNHSAASIRQPVHHRSPSRP